MSGGKFNYNCFKISEFAADLQHEIDINDEEGEDSFDGYQGGQHMSKDTLHILQQAQKTIEYAGQLAKEIEWLYSMDHSEESFIKLVTDINVQAVMDACEQFKNNKVLMDAVKKESKP